MVYSIMLVLSKIFYLFIYKYIVSSLQERSQEEEWQWLLNEESNDFLAWMVFLGHGEF